MRKAVSKNRIAEDSFALTSMKLLTMVTSIACTMILSHSIPLTEYGTYSTGNLIISTATSISAFGLLDSVNYYYNGTTGEERNCYINTVIALVLICGILGGFFIFLGRGLISAYFHNPALASIYGYILFRPVLANLGECFQYIQVSIGKAKIVALRNGLISIAKLAAVTFTAFYTQNIAAIFAFMLTAEAFSALFYYAILVRNHVHICPQKFDFSKVREIMGYCVPMGIYIQANVISRDLDKFVIGFFEQTDRLAIYANCAGKLPLNILSSPLLIVTIPVLTRCIRNDEYENAAQLFRGNIKIGCTFTLASGVMVIVLAGQAIQFLYGELYLSGLGVFVLYIIVDILNFVSFSLVLAAKGKTGTLMVVSCTALLANLILNFLLYFLLGFIGPAIATVLVTCLTNLALLKISGNVLNTPLKRLFDLKYMVKLSVELAGTALAAYILRQKACEIGIHYMGILIVLGGGGVACILALNYQELVHTFQEMNCIYSQSGPQ